MAERSDAVQMAVAGAQSLLRSGLPYLALAVMLVVIVSVQPNILSYFGFNLLFKLSIPLILAAYAQMLVIGLGDIDLSIGSFVGLVTCVVAIFFADRLWLGLLILARWPINSVYILGLFLGIDLIFAGAGWIGLGFGLRRYQASSQVRSPA